MLGEPIARCGAGRYAAEMPRPPSRQTLAELALDPFLQTLATRDPLSQMTEAQVAGFLQISPDVLSQWRREGKKPPNWLDPQQRPGEPPRSGRTAVRYFVGSVREYALALFKAAEADFATPGNVAPGNSRELVTSPRKVPQHTSFAKFLATAPADDEWLFMRTGPRRRPVDFIYSLDLEPGEDDAAEWMTLAAYLDALRTAAHEEAMAEIVAKDRDAIVAAAPSAPSTTGRARS